MKLLRIIMTGFLSVSLLLAAEEDVEAPSRAPQILPATASKDSVHYNWTKENSLEVPAEIFTADDLPYRCDYSQIDRVTFKPIRIKHDVRSVSLARSVAVSFVISSRLQDVIAGMKLSETVFNKRRSIFKSLQDSQSPSLNNSIADAAYTLRHRILRLDSTTEEGKVFLNGKSLNSKISYLSTAMTGLNWVSGWLSQDISQSFDQVNNDLQIMQVLAFCFSHLDKLCFSEIPKTEEAIKSALFNKYAVIVRLSVNNSFTTDQAKITGVIESPENGKNAIGDYAMVIFGYDDETRRYTVKNLWDPSYGVNGFIYIPYDYIQSSSTSEVWGFGIPENQKSSYSWYNPWRWVGY